MKELLKIILAPLKKIVLVILDRNKKNLYPLIKVYLYSECGITFQFNLHNENPK